MAVTAYDDTVKLVDESWDQAEADARWRAHTGSNSSPSRAYRDAFSWYDSSALELFGSYKLQIRDFKNGEEFVNLSAVRNALARLDQTDGPTDNERDEIRNNLQRYLARAAEDTDSASARVDAVAEVPEGNADGSKNQDKESEMDTEQIKAEERKRISALEKLASSFPVARQIVDAAIESGASANDILADVLAADKSQQAARASVDAAASETVASVMPDSAKASEEENSFRLLFKAQGLKVKE